MCCLKNLYNKISQKQNKKSIVTSKILYWVFILVVRNLKNLLGMTFRTHINLLWGNKHKLKTTNVLRELFNQFKPFYSENARCSLRNWI